MRSKVSMSSAARAVGKRSDFFIIMKATSKSKFEYIKALYPDNLAEAYRKYDDMVVDTKYRFEQLYFELLMNKSLWKFSQHLRKIGLYKNDRSFIVTCYDIIKPAKLNVKHTTFLKMQNVLKAYEEFKAQQQEQERDSDDSDKERK